MQHFLKYFSSISLFFLFLQCFSPAAAAAAGDLNELCFQLQESYVDYHECQQTFLEDPRSSTANYSELAVIAVDVLVAHSARIQTIIGQSLKNESNDASTKEALETCSKAFSNGLPTLQKAKDAAAAKKYAVAALTLESYASTPQTCMDEAWAKHGGIPALPGAELGAFDNLIFAMKSTQDIVAQI